VPVPDPDSAGFWESARSGVLTIARCSDCRRWQHPPAEACRHCGGALAFEPVTGLGEVFSFIVVRQATVPGHEAPYVVALVQLAEDAGVRLVGVLRVAQDVAAVGLAVRVELVRHEGEDLPAIEFVAVGPP
jgi:uncharacterized OB-fold protein